MIYTVTFNPALDYVVKVDHFTPGRVNRTVREDIYCGGKGFNVSAVLKNLGYDSTALGFVAGFTGDEIVKRAGALGISPDFIRVDRGMSRINVKLKSDEESEINGMGPEITAKDVALLLEKLEKLKAGDVLILSGSIPHSLDDGIYERIMAGLDKRGILTVVDAERKLLLNVLKYHPFLIKPNNHELGDMFGTVLKADAEITEHAVRLQAMGARNVLISMAGDGAILVDESGHTHRIAAPEGTVRNSVGAGDSMVAGFVAGYLERAGRADAYEHALRLGSAAGSASAFSEGLASGEAIMRLYDRPSADKRTGDGGQNHVSMLHL